MSMGQISARTNFLDQIVSYTVANLFPADIKMIRPEISSRMGELFTIKIDKRGLIKREFILL